MDVHVFMSVSTYDLCEALCRHTAAFVIHKSEIVSRLLELQVAALAVLVK